MGQGRHGCKPWSRFAGQRWHGSRHEWYGPGWSNGAHGPDVFQGKYEPDAPNDCTNQRRTAAAGRSDWAASAATTASSTVSIDRRLTFGGHGIHTGTFAGDSPTAESDAW